MKKLIVSVFLISLFKSAIAFANNTSSNISNNNTNKVVVNTFTPLPSTVNQLGFAFEERSSYADVYAFFNQLIDNTYFYELRGYYIHNYIVNSPIKTVSASNQSNVIGTGVVGIFGYNTQINSAVSFMPFIRLQVLTNTSSAYEDNLGNKINSVNYAASLGGKLTMQVNELFSVYVQYYAGYQRSVLRGEGVFDTHNQPRINSLTSTLEFGLPYKITKAWSLTPYFQFTTSDNNPNKSASSAPYSTDRLTSTGNVYAVKLAYKF